MQTEQIRTEEDERTLEFQAACEEIAALEEQLEEIVAEHDSYREEERERIVVAALDWLLDVRRGTFTLDEAIIGVGDLS